MTSFWGIPFAVYLVTLCILTAAIRVIPFFVPIPEKLPPYLQRCMDLLPIAAIGALVFPGAFHDYGAAWFAGIGGTLTAFLIGYKRKPLIAGIVAAIVVTYLLLGVPVA